MNIPGNIKVLCPEFLEKAREFAERRSLLPSLERALERVARPCGTHASRVVLSKDFAPYSFYFFKETENADGTWSAAYNGGVIFSGVSDENSPSFVTRCTPDDGWNIHT